jgi:NAD+ synthase (glutamine-hydrolysing)
MPVRIALAQMNATVGDVAGNAERILTTLDEARAHGAAIVAFPELFLCGYPPQDLLFHPRFVEIQEQALSDIAAGVGDELVIIGYARRGDKGLHNSAALLHQGAVAGRYDKIHLPNYGVFDEKRYFTPGEELLVASWGDLTVGINVCEDIWPDGAIPWTQCRSAGAQIIVNISSSPFHMGRESVRHALAKSRARAMGGYLAYVNLVGGQDELIFDGGSFVTGPDGTVLARAPRFRPEILFADIPLPIEGASPDSSCDGPTRPVRQVVLPGRPAQAPDKDALTADSVAADEDEEVYEALVLSTRDYVRKNGFSQVILGISGGLDSALVASVAVDALGPDNVHGLAMPSRYSSEASLTDARDLAGNLGLELREVPIDTPFQAFLDIFADLFPGMPHDVTEENIQARIRGNLLMAVSNKRGRLVLTTGNKSEVSVGYATLYGDTAGAFAVIADVFKTRVYRLARWRNSQTQGPWIPDAIITKPPSAELRPDQQDTDSLPPYEELDAILMSYVEENRSVDEITAQGHDPDTVRRILHLVDRAEFKRRQFPPCPKITPHSFGRDRRMPITSRFRV